MNETFVEPVELDELNKKASPKPNGEKKINLSKLANVKVQIDVCLGHTELTVQELAELGKHSIVTLDRNINDLVEVTVDGKTVALGSLVAVGDNFGIHISEIKE